ncbi:ATP-binding protein [Actinomadura oligospora]|uniref:ATP-binding protein n=1 Tax=Actinomadura oligospora TaxID=111804 RepID=UPI00047DC24A|nr:AAA family ATPase [Actinomadura oligospora]
MSAPAGRFGRSAETSLIGGFLDRVMTDGEALLLVGEPGIGKTALLDDAAGYALAAGFQVVRAAGAEFEADIALAGLGQLLASFPPSSRTNLPVSGKADCEPADVRIRALSEIREAARERPLLLVVDDLHWLDRSSVEVLGFVARRLSGAQVGLLVAARPAPDGSPGALESWTMRVHEVRRLDGAASNELLRARFPNLPARLLRQVQDEAQGNPLALLELAGTLMDRPGCPLADASETPPARRVQNLFASQVARLPAAGRTLLLLAVLDGTGELDVLRAASGDLELAGLGPAERAGLVYIDAESRRLRFRHPLIRAGVVASTPADERRAAHRVLAGTLGDDQQERRAWHLAEATLEPDESVAEIVETAADSALDKGDARLAVTTLRRAAVLSPRPADRARRLTRAAYTARVRGDLRDVMALLAEARQADPASEVSLEAAVTRSYLLLTDDGDLDAAHRLLVTAIEKHANARDAFPNDDVPNDEILDEAFQSLLRLCWFGGRPDLWKPFEDLAARVPERAARFSRFYSDPARSTSSELARLDAAVAALPRRPDDLGRIVDSAIFLDRLGEARQPLLRIVAGGRSGEGAASLHVALIALALDDFHTGRWDEADRLITELLGLSRDLGYQMIWPSQHVQALLAAARGDFETTWTLTDAMSRWAEPRGLHAATWYRQHARTLAALGQGDFEYAYRQASAISPAGTFVPHVPHALWVAMDLVESAVHTGRHAEAEAHVAAMRDNLVAELSPRLALITRASEAVAAATDDRAGRLFEEALALPDVERWPFDLARVHLAYGSRLRRAQSRLKARDHLSTALERFEWLGAHPWATRAANEIRATGRARPGNAPSAPVHLTPQEREIAVLAARGLTNKQIGERLRLSHRTVSSHLHRLYPKLGITTRTALNDALADLPPEGPEGT